MSTKEAPITPAQEMASLQIKLFEPRGSPKLVEAVIERIQAAVDQRTGASQPAD